MEHHPSQSQSGTAVSAARDEKVAVLLEQMTEATSQLATGLDAAGLIRPLRESPAYALRALDRSLPSMSVEELLLTCEAFAMVTAPSAVAMGELSRLREEAQRILRLLNTLRTAIHGRRRLTGSTTTGVQATLLRSAFTEPDVRAALTTLRESFARLALLDSDDQGRRRPLFGGLGCFVPGTVLLSALGLIAFLLTSIAFATGQVAISSNGVQVPALSDAIQHGGANVARPTATPIPQPTATPRPQPTVTPASAPPALLVSRPTVQPCFGTPDRFSLAYTNGSSPIQWAATWNDTTNVALSPASGTLQPAGSGGSTTITVTLVNDGNFTGTITISTSNNLRQNVTYDSSGC